ncbi:EAL domain-containing protein [Pontibacterium granulatum]|uniref:putative bifunctional diguanylate cyclase/phosphodiesterase n=1 Tax=Pontibacterium granulatum TaxID=2036029 RepID=UPI00249A309C|nr:EAL domain-containing protein [Pontibacterium granulatum]MDI3326521.1 EAL domain-containing protein [Pontibacterium granulatum]
MSINRQSLRKKLMLLLMIVSCSVLSLVTLGFAISDWISSRDDIYDRMRAQASIIGQNSVAALTFSDPEAAERTLITLRNTHDIVGAVLFDNNQQPFSSYRRDNAKLPIAPQATSEGSLAGTLFVQIPIELDGEQIGSIVLLSELGNWQQQQLHRMTIVFGLFLFSLLVAMVLSNVGQQIVTRPILSLARTARRITDTRNYDLRAEKLSNDEIGSLADDFNQMLDQIQQTEKELRDAQCQLEDKVNERTSELLALTEQLEHQAFHDTLTGLANRATFDTNLQAAINYASRRELKLTVMFLDLDRFKSINDTLGHAVGDKLLIEMADRLRQCLRQSDTLARLGGDEFALLLPDSSPNAAAEVATKVIEAVKHPIHVKGYNLQVTTSIGISIFPDNGADASTILKNADTAMYSSKEAGRNQFSFFSPEMNAITERRLLLENKLRRAISDNRFTIHYQPKWNVHNGEMVGVEALVRWFDDEEGFISPEEFIPLAEDCGLVSTIDDWVCKNACLQIQSLFAQGAPTISLSVNLSPTQVMHKDIYNRISTILTETGFPGHRLELEVTEAMLSAEVEHLQDDLDQLRPLGVEVSIDDFGTGYSSLSRLKNLPINTLKIDRSFINDIGQDSGDEVIIRTIIDMAHNLNLRVVAEGIETEEQHEFVRRYNCDMVQGYLFSRPVPLDELAQLLAESERHHTVNSY